MNRNESLCIACGQCYEVCPTDIFQFDKTKKVLTVAHPEECWYCGAFIYDCPVEGALRMEFPLAVL
jgi:NAD-dependent dihydropyrimidine dehydrogenase PreA subunit